MAADRREKLVILGGGAAAMTAAFELSRPGWQDRFESITVYQVGWRLGGKGASGRGRHGRIEEHGLHLWLGFYENAFRVMQECYEELGQPPGAPLRRWDDAFKKSSQVVLEEKDGDRWKHWPILYPEDDRLPGIPDPRDPALTMWYFLRRALGLLESFIGELPSPGAREPEAREGSGRSLRERLGRPLAELAGRLDDAVHGAGVAALAAAVAVAERIRPRDSGATRRGLVDRDSATEHGELARLVEALRERVRHRIEGLGEIGDRVRRLWYLTEITAACILGAIRDGVLTGGFSAIDDRDFREWLRSHGASAEAVDSPVVIGGYDLAFAFRGGDPTQPQMAAGVALQNAARLFFSYKGAMFWKMQAGMGDVVFSPLYLVLKRRGVQFRFFHRVTNLRLSSDRRSVAAIDMTRQAELDSAEYDPLVDMDGVPSWPAEPRWEQLRDADRLRGHDLESLWAAPPGGTPVTLDAGRDFDRVIFGISLGAVPHVCPELVAADPRWRAMVDRVQTVPTQAFQVWLTAATGEIGWPWPLANSSSFVEPFDTYADMSHLLGRERWPAGDEPRSVAYFCNVLPPRPQPPQAPNPEYAAACADDVKGNAIAFLRAHSGHFWPGAVGGNGEFRWELLAGGAASTGAARFDSQFWRANVDPSEHYVLSLPGTAAFRIKPGETGFDNLVITGDWTDCGLNAGCVEAAVMSGRLAANALTGRPALKEIIGYME